MADATDSHATRDAIAELHDHEHTVEAEAPLSPAEQAAPAPDNEELQTARTDDPADDNQQISDVDATIPGEEAGTALAPSPVPSPPRLLQTRSSPSLLMAPEPTVFTGSTDTAVAVTPLPTPVAAPTVKSSSFTHKPQAKDTSLRIFFPTDDLALKAILSPPILRTALSSGTRLTANTQPAPAANQSSTTEPAKSTQPSLAESILEHTSRLFFLRGNSAKSQDTTASKTDPAPPPPTEPQPTQPATPSPTRPSTMSIALEEDISKLNHTIVAAHPNLPPPPFANMFSCENCHDDIGSLLTQGRHHCRNCGGSFCATCSSKTTMVPYQLYLTKGEQRVCDGCFARIKEFHTQAQTTQVTWGGLPPPSADALAMEFGLPPSEPPVTVFNCSYFVDFAPFYGHLILTREHLCFRGYRTHKIKIPFADFHSLVKPEFYYINALQITVKSTKEKLFFAEFNGLRDLCFLRIDQLIRAFQEGVKLQPLTSEDLKQQALGRRRSYKLLANSSSSSNSNHDLASFIAASANGSVDVDDEEEEDDKSSVDDAVSTTSSNSSGLNDDANEPFVPLPPDPLLSKMTMLLDCELRADVQVVFDSLWSDDLGQQFQRSHMEKTKDIDIDISDWRPVTPEASDGFAISKENDYTVFRHVRSQHPPKTKFPGLPPYAVCCRTQRLRVEKSSDGSKWNRFVVSELLRMTKIPFCDYFEIETRWVFTRDGKNYCHAQAGLIVNFLKSTWFKSQIDSSTRSETKEGLELWAKNALLFLSDHVTVPARMRRPSAAPVVQPLSTGPVVVDTKPPPSRRASVQAMVDEKPRPKMSETTTPVERDTTPVAPPSLVQWITLVLLLYCVVVIHGQQTRIQQLSDTTARLLAHLEDRRSVQLHAERGPLASVCEQRVVEGAVESLTEFFADRGRLDEATNH